MAIIIALALLVLGTILLLWGADWLIDGVRSFSQRAGVSLLVLGIVLVSLEPEEMLTAAWASGQGAGRLALGDVIGTNLTLITLALGLAALIAPLVFTSTIHRQALITAAISLPALVLLLLLPINRLIGVFLLVLFVGYIFVLLRTDRQALERLATIDGGNDEVVVQARENPGRETLRLPELHANLIGDIEHMNTATIPRVFESEPSTSPNIPVQAQPLWFLIVMALGGLIALAAGGFLVVHGALQLAVMLGLDQEVMGATIVALGTGAEMIALGVAAARKGQQELFVGGVFGSFAYNLLVTLGLAAIVRSLPVLPTLLQWSTAGMIVVFLLVLLLVWRGKIGRAMGVILIALYLCYLVATTLGGILLAH